MTNRPFFFCFLFLQITVRGGIKLPVEYTRIDSCASLGCQTCVNKTVVCSQCIDDGNWRPDGRGGCGA